MMDASEFKQRFLPFHRRLYCVAFSLTGNREDAEDMVQDAYLRLWDRRDELDRVVNAEAFCVTVLKNVCFNALRSRKPISATEDETMPVAADVDVGREVEGRDAVSVVSELIKRLPPNQRQVIVMRDVGDCPYEEIEAATGMSAGNIRTLLSRARKKIKEQFTAIQNYELKKL